jgi:hypothetical protein
MMETVGIVEVVVQEEGAVASWWWWWWFNAPLMMIINENSTTEGSGGVQRLLQVGLDRRLPQPRLLLKTDCSFASSVSIWRYRLQKLLF